MAILCYSKRIFDCSPFCITLGYIPFLNTQRRHSNTLASIQDISWHCGSILGGCSLPLLGHGLGQDSLGSFRGVGPLPAKYGARGLWYHAALCKFRRRAIMNETRELFTSCRNFWSISMTFQRFFSGMENLPMTLMPGDCFCKISSWTWMFLCALQICS